VDSTTELPLMKHHATPFDEMLLDRIVLKVRDNSLRKKLVLQENTLTLDQAVRICESSKVTLTIMQSVAKGASSGSADVIYKAQSRYPKH